MKHIQLYESWVFENVQAAKAYMLKRAAASLGKAVNELTPEEQTRALNNRQYKEVLELLGQKYNGYLGTFVKFHFEQRIPVDQLKQLLDQMIKYRQLVSTLPYPVDAYSNGNPEPGSTISGFEALMDQFRTFEFNTKGKWIIDALPKELRDQARALDPEKQKELIRIGWTIADQGDAIKTRVMSKVNRYRTIQDFMKYATDISSTDESSQKLVAQAESLSPEIQVMYDDNNYVVFSVRTEAAQKAIFRMANWCLNTGSWDSYVSRGVQLNILNFNVPNSDPMFVTGTTVLASDSSVKASHDANDRSIKKDSDPATHLQMNGYPEDLVNQVMSLLPSEIVVKTVLANIMSKAGVDAKIQSLAVAGHDLETLTDPIAREAVEKDLLVIIDKEFESENFSTDAMLQGFKKHGILSMFAAKLYHKLLVGKISQEDVDAIFAKTERGFELLARNVNNWPDPKIKAKITAVLAAKDQILNLARTV